MKEECPCGQITEVNEEGYCNDCAGLSFNQRFDLYIGVDVLPPKGWDNDGSKEQHELELIAKARKGKR